MAGALCLRSGVAGSGLLVPQSTFSTPKCKMSQADLKLAKAQPAMSMLLAQSGHKPVAALSSTDMFNSQGVGQLKKQPEVFRTADGKKAKRRVHISAALVNGDGMFSGRVQNVDPTPAAETSGRDNAAESNAGSPADELLGRAIEFAASIEEESARQRALERKLRRKSERAAYQVAAIASTLGFTALAGAAVYHRFLWQIPVSINILRLCDCGLPLRKYTTGSTNVHESSTV
jgi:hypothetical protein